jgi:predicted NACHT family NTPase
VVKQIEAADVRIVVLHHPFEWLAEFDRHRVEERLGRAAHFILCGHQHVPQVRVQRGTGGDCVVIPAGATYERRTPDNPRYTNAYNFVCFDFKTSRGTVYLRRWNDRGGEWVKDVETHSGGRYPFRLPKSFVNRAERIRKGGPSAPGKKDRLAAVEEKYRTLLLKSCDIINVRNLPEDRYIVHRQLELRRLYVPLRARVEAKIDQRGDSEPAKAFDKSRATVVISSRTTGEQQPRERIPVGEQLAKSKRLVLLGDPGSGKTTLISWIATAYLLHLKQDPELQALPDVKTLPDEDWLPVIVRCRDLDAASLSGAIEDIFRHTLRQQELSDIDAAVLVDGLLKRLRTGTAVLMLDGLDEIADLRLRFRLCERLEKVVIAYPKAPVIATSRIFGYREMECRLGRGFEHLTLVDLTPEEKDDFADRWSALTELAERKMQAAEELKRDIHSTERIERLTGNPMLLTTIALVKRKVGKLPNRRADLYWEAVQVLLNWRREVDESLDWREAIPQLEYLAYEMCYRGVQQLPEDEMIEQFADMRNEFPNVYAAQRRTPEDFLRRVEAHTGILIAAGLARRRGYQMPVYEFRHPTLQEYLAARTN